MSLSARFATCGACKSPVAVKWVQVCRRCSMRLGPVCAETHKCRPPVAPRPAPVQQTLK